MVLYEIYSVKSRLTAHVHIVGIESEMNVTFYNFTLTVVNSIVTTYILLVWWSLTPLSTIF